MYSTDTPEEINADARLFLRHRRTQDFRPAVGDQNGAVCLARNASILEDERATAPGDFFSRDFKHLYSFTYSPSERRTGRPMPANAVAPRLMLNGVRRGARYCCHFCAGHGAVCAHGFYRPVVPARLAPQFQSFDKVLVPFLVLLLGVVEQSAALSDHDE